MKASTTLLAASALLLVIAGNAYAAINAALERDIQWASGGNTNITYVVDGDTVTLSGVVENEVILNNIIKAAEDNGAETIVGDVIRLSAARETYVPRRTN